MPQISENNNKKKNKSLFFSIKNFSQIVQVQAFGNIFHKYLFLASKSMKKTTTNNNQKNEYTNVYFFSYCSFILRKLK